MVESTKNVDVPKAKLREIFSTPSECFHFLTLEHGFHLPPRPYTDMDFMSELWDGTRKAYAGEYQIEVFAGGKQPVATRSMTLATTTVLSTIPSPPATPRQ